jgi:hypothetical protein
MSGELIKSATVADLAIRINEAHARAIEHAGRALDDALACGEMLVQAKARCPHGKWLPWLRGNITFSERTAQSYMQLAGSREAIEREREAGHFGVKSALKRLATARRYTFEQELSEHVRSQQERRRHAKPVGQWTPDDARSCIDGIREFDELMHRHGYCGGDCCCLVCASEKRLCEPRCHACADEVAA